MIDTIDRIEQLAASGAEIMEDCIAAGQAAQQEGDQRRVIIGALANAISKRYADNSVGTFAKNINLVASTVRQYMTAVRYYGRQTLADLIDTAPLSWTHFRDAMRLNSRDASLGFLSDVADEGLPPEAARVRLLTALGKPMPVRTLVNVRDAIVWQVNYERGMILLRVPGDGLADLRNLPWMDAQHPTVHLMIRENATVLTFDEQLANLEAVGNE